MFFTPSCNGKSDITNDHQNILVKKQHKTLLYRDGVSLWFSHKLPLHAQLLRVERFYYRGEGSLLV